LSESFYPDTSFIDDHLQNYYERCLVRAIYVADFLADGNPVAREWFGSVAAVEFYANDPTRQEHVNAVTPRIGELISNALLPQLLAKGNQEIPLTAEMSEKKGKGLMQVWRLIQASPLAGLPHAEGATPRAVMAARDEAMGKYDLGHAILYLDYLRVLPPATQSPTTGDITRPVPPRPHSVFREAILRPETLTRTVFDECFDTIRYDAMKGAYDTGMAIVQNRWNSWHEENFLPESYRAQVEQSQNERRSRPYAELSRDEELNLIKSKDRWEAVRNVLGLPPAPNVDS
jgi:hypothetical protein